jgi:D-tyrosyl-tRNA(Tyr) deacylase
VKTIVQRVRSANVRVEGEIVGEIGLGVVCFVGVERGDTEADAHITGRKIAGLRVFPGRTPMDQNLGDIGGGALVISQFTLAGKVSKGRRPSFNRAEEPARATELYMEVAREIERAGIPIATGVFGAHMIIEMTHDGPVTLRIETESGVITS